MWHSVWQITDRVAEIGVEKSGSFSNCHPLACYFNYKGNATCFAIVKLTLLKSYLSLSGHYVDLIIKADSIIDSD